jgi:hypothetical protein
MRHEAVDSILFVQVRLREYDKYSSLLKHVGQV